MGKEARAVLKKPSCPVHSYADDDAPLSKRRAAPSATFGTATSGRGLSPRSLPKTLPAIPPVGREATDFKQPHIFHATFGKSQRGPRPRSGCKVHSYDVGSATTHTFAATFGTASRFGDEPLGGVAAKVRRRSSAGLLTKPLPPPLESHAPEPSPRELLSDALGSGSYCS